MNIDLLEKNEFFIGLKSEEIGKILESVKYSFEEYKRGSVIANEEEECSCIGLILDGVIEIQRIYPSGNSIIVKRLRCGDVFGEALVFSKESTYPATIMSTTDSKILFVNKNEILRLCVREERILEVINFILELQKNQQSELIKLKSSKEDIASYLGIPRPSLSRELIKLREDKLIEFDRASINILNLEALEEELFK